MGGLEQLCGSEIAGAEVDGRLLDLDPRRDSFAPGRLCVLGRPNERIAGLACVALRNRELAEQLRAQIAGSQQIRRPAK